MASTPKPSLTEALDHVKGEVGKDFDSTLTRMSEKFSSFWTNIQTLKSTGVATLLSTPAGKCLDSSAKKIGQSVGALGRNVQNLKSNSASAISSSVSGIVLDFNTLRKNVETNVADLKSGGAGRTSSQVSFSSPAATPVIPFPTSSRDMLKESASPRVDMQTVPESSQPLSFSTPTNANSPDSFFSSEEIPEETPHPDHSSVSATTVFSIGYLGPPLLGPADPESFSVKFNNAKQAPTKEIPGVLEIALWPSGPVPVLRLEDVRISIGKALIVFNKIRSLGLKQTSWVNKTPWASPRPASLAKGLQWPRQKFSSVNDRNEYHKRARRRGRYLIGQLPGWSWFAADIIFLYFLINNPAGNFLI